MGSKRFLVLGVFALLLISSISFFSPYLGRRDQPVNRVVDVSSPNWMDKWVNQEFAYFEEKGITKKTLETTWERCLGRNGFLRYKIIASKVYGPKSRLKNLLEVLVKTYPVPDVDFIYFYDDIMRPPILKGKPFFSKAVKKNAPILISAKDRSEQRVVLFIDWHYNILKQDAGWNVLIKQLNENQDRWEWSKKIEKLFWRGSPVDGQYSWGNWSSIPRGRVVYDSKYRYPELIDASFIKFSSHFCRDSEHFIKDVGISAFISPVDHLEYKYQLDVDGVTCTFPALQWKLLSGCLVMKQQTEDVMWFHGELTPWKHYIPLYADLRDTEEKVRWAKEHDEEAREIAQNGREFALTHLMPEHILLYCYKTLVKYASLQKFQPTLSKEDKKTFSN